MNQLNPLAYCLLLTANYVTKLSRDIMVPAIPAIAVFYGTTPTMAKLTMSWYFLGIACSRLLWPVLADQYCKRNMLLLMHLLFILASIACTQESAFIGFALGRFGQAFTIASIPLLIRSVIYQHHGSIFSIKLYGYLSPLTAWSSAIAVAIGSLLIGYFTLPVLSQTLVLFALANMLVIWRIPKENKQPPAPKTIPRQALASYLEVARNKRFWSVALPFALLVAGNALYLVMAAYLLLTPGLLSLAEFAVAGFVVMAGLVFGRVCAGALVSRFSIPRLLAIAPVIALVFALIGLLISSSGFNAPPWLFLGLIAGNYFAIGLISVVAKGCVGDLVPKRVTTALGLLTWLESLFAFALILAVSWISSTFTVLFAIFAGLACAALVVSRYLHS